MNRISKDTETLGTDIFSRNVQPIKNTSWDKENSEYMLDNEVKVINFDMVKDEYFKNYHLTDTPKSADALYISEAERLLIEFKNGTISKESQYAIAGKVYDSMLLYSDITGETLKRTSKMMDFVLVYNASHNTDREGEEKAKMANPLAKKAKTRFARFGLQRFEGYCFRNVYTCAAEEFERDFL